MRTQSYLIVILLGTLPLGSSCKQRTSSTVLAASTSGGLATRQPYRGNEKIDVTHYDVKMIIPQIAGPTFSVNERIELTAVQDIDVVDLHFEPLTTTIQTISSDQGALKYSVTNGISNKYGLDGHILQINLATTLTAGTSLSLTIDYTVDITTVTYGLKYKANFNGKKILNGTNWPYYTRFWLPSNDSPEDPATVNFEMHVAPGLVAAANGKLTEGDAKTGSGLDDQGLRVFKWQQVDPIPTYGFNPVVGEFLVESSDICFAGDNSSPGRSVCTPDSSRIPFSYYHQGPEQKLPADLVKGQAAAVFYSQNLALYPYVKLGYVIAPQPFFMEYPSLISLPKIGASVHELLHHWFGDTVQIRTWGDFWISEGFTTYLTGFYDEAVNGTNSAELCPDNAKPLNFTADTDPLSIFDDTPYCKGAYAIEQLRRTVAKLTPVAFGSKEERTLFLAVVRGIFLRHRFAAAGTLDLVNDLRAHLADDISAAGFQVDNAACLQAINAWKSLVLVDID